MDGRQYSIERLELRGTEEVLRNFIAGFLTDLHGVGEVRDVLKCMTEIGRRIRAGSCKVWTATPMRPVKSEDWISYADVAAVLVTDVVLDECGDRELSFWLGWIRPGENSAPMEAMVAAMETVARESGCGALTAASGRAGWEKWAERFGFERRTTIYRKELEAGIPAGG